MTTTATLRPSTDIAKSSRLLFLLSFFAIYVVWGSTYLAIRFAAETMPPFVTVSLRHSSAGLILLGWAWSRGYRLKLEHLKAGAIQGALFFLIGHGTLHWAEQYVASGLAALLVATEPLWILAIASGMGDERINWKNGLGLAAGMAGVWVLTGSDLSLHNSLGVGIFLVLAGAASWAIGVCIAPRLKLPEEPTARAAVPLVCGAVMLLIAATLTKEFQHTNWGAISAKSWGGLAYLIVCGSVVAFTAYTWLLQHISATMVATHTFVNPVVAVFVGWLFAAEPISTRLLSATALILVAIFLIQRGDRHNEMQAEGVQGD